jgi:hypothetical protein
MKVFQRPTFLEVELCEKQFPRVWQYLQLFAGRLQHNNVAKLKVDQPKGHQAIPHKNKPQNCHKPREVNVSGLVVLSKRALACVFIGRQGRHFNHLTALIRAHHSFLPLVPSAPIYPRRSWLLLRRFNSRLSLFGDATAHYFSFMMLSNINRAGCCEKGKLGLLPAAAGKNNATPSASQLPRDEKRWIEVKQKQPEPQANGFLILSLALARVCVWGSPLYSLREMANKRACECRIFGFGVYLAGNFMRSLIVL